MYAVEVVKGDTSRSPSAACTNTAGWVPTKGQRHLQVGGNNRFKCAKGRHRQQNGPKSVWRENTKAQRKKPNLPKAELQKERKKG